MEVRDRSSRNITSAWWSLPTTVLVSIALTLAILELGARFFLPDPLDPLRNGRQLILRSSEDRDIRYELTPGARGRAWDTDVVINAAGFRGPEVEVDKRDKYRIVVLGDSITFGNNLPPEAPFPYQLQRLLSQEESGRFEVLNFAVGGYDTLQEVAVLHRRALVFQPDLVIVAYCLNDMGVASINEAYLKRIETYRHNLLYSLRLVQYLDQHFSGWTIDNWENQINDPATFARTFKGRIDPIGPEEEELRALMKSAPQVMRSNWYRDPSNWYRDEAHVGRLRYAFRWLKELSQQSRFQVVLLLLPFMDWTPQGYPHEVLHRIVELEGRRLGFKVLDISAEFRAHAANELALGGADPVHPNELGHRIMAGALHRYLRTILPKKNE